MWLEIVLSQTDLATILREVTPITLTLGDQQSISIEAPSEVTLHADVGLRVTCAAKVKWPVLGIAVPVTIHRLVVTFAPEVVHTKDGAVDLLVFNLRLEHADFAGVPQAIDNRLSKAIDDALVAHRLDLGWKFTETLAGAIPLPSTLDPIDGVAVNVAWGKVKVTDEAMVMALSVHHAFHRRGEPLETRAISPQKPAPIASPRDALSPAAPWVVAVGVGAFAGAMLGAWLWRRNS